VYGPPGGILPADDAGAWETQASGGRLAIARMRAEADHLGSDGIVGVQLRMQSYVWGQGVLEFIATGCVRWAAAAPALRGAHRAPDGRAFTSDLSAQDFFRLLAAGAVPVAFVLGVCVYHIAHQSAMQSLRQAGRNQEMVIFTQGIYEARELALARMQATAAQAGCSGIVGNRRGQQSRLGRARYRVPRHRNRHPTPRR
jgi:uncharacterized protein YbjQ (UPF0145 family)